MNKFLLIFSILCITSSSFAQDKNIYQPIKLGQSVDEVRANLGKPDIMTKDAHSENTYIYENKQIQPCKFCTQFQNGNKSILVIKFDKNYYVKNFAYHTSFGG